MRLSRTPTVVLGGASECDLMDMEAAGAPKEGHRNEEERDVVADEPALRVHRIFLAHVDDELRHRHAEYHDLCAEGCEGMQRGRSGVQYGP